MVVGEHPAHLVELADDRLALEATSSGGVPGAEHLDGAFQCLDLLGADGRGLVAVVARGVGLERAPEALRLLGEGGVGVEPVVHGVGEGGAGGEHGARAHQTATVEHEVHSREFGEDRGCAFGRPWHSVGVLLTPVRLPSAGAPLPYEPEVLDGHDTTEPLGEQCCQYRGHRFARGLPHVDPAPYPRGVGGQLGVAHGRRLPIDHPREFAFRPAGQAEQVVQAGVRTFAHVKPPGSRLS